MDPVVQYTRLTHSDKLPDRFITSQVYRPSEAESQSQGVVFSQVEILNPWLPATQVGQTIINTAIREYYRASDTSELNNFETALKKVNETLAQITQSGETDWIGHLNGVLILINGADIHISQTGQTEAYLFRGSKVNHITEGLMQNTGDPHPLKTFSSISSGTLQMRDRIVIGSPAFFEAIDIGQLKEAVQNQPPFEAARACAKLLYTTHKTEAEALFLELTTKEDVDSMPPEDKNDTVYLDQQKNSLRLAGAASSIARYGKPALNFIALNSKRIYTAASAKFKSHVVPAAQKASQRSYDATRLAASKAWQKVSKKEVGTGEASFTPHTPSKLSPALQSAKKAAAPLIGWLGSRFRLKNSTDRGRAYGIWGAALLIVLVIIIAVNHFGTPATPKTAVDTQALAATLGEKFNRVKLLSAYNDKNAAIGELTDIIKQTDDAASQAELPSSLQELRKQAVTELNGLTNTVMLSNITTVAEWGNRPFLVALGDNLYAINNDKLTNATSGVDTDVTSAGEVKAVAGDSDTQSILIMGTKGMWRFKAADQTLTEVTLTDGSAWPPNSAFAAFADNLYLLNSTANQIVKCLPDGGNYTDCDAYSQPAEGDLANATDLALNGSILALKSSGEIVKLSRASRSIIAPSNLPIAGFIASPKHIFAHTDSTNIAIWHNNPYVPNATQVTVLTRAGSYQKSYMIPTDYGTVQDARYDLIAKKITFITDRGIYSASAE